MAGVKTITFYVLLCICVLLCGCTTSKNGVTHHFIVGFGVVSVNNAQTNLAVIQKATMIGVYGNTGPTGRVGLGYMKVQTIEIATNSNLLIDVSSTKRQIQIIIPCTNHSSP
jgi:hypothetical protein